MYPLQINKICVGSSLDPCKVWLELSIRVNELTPKKKKNRHFFFFLNSLIEKMWGYTFRGVDLYLVLTRMSDGSHRRSMVFVVVFVSVSASFEG